MNNNSFKKELNSEFQQDGYETSIIYRILSTMLDFTALNSSDNLSLEWTENTFNYLLSTEIANHHSGKTRFLEISIPTDSYLRDFSDFQYIDLEKNDHHSVRLNHEIDYRSKAAGTDRIDISPYISELQKKLSAILSQAKHRRYYDNKTVTAYLEHYLLFTKKVVFNPRNNHLYSRQFRKSALITNLYGLGKRKLTVAGSTQEHSRTFDCLGIYNPFALDIIRRIINEYPHDYRGIAQERSLYKLRKHIYIRQVEKAFTHFISDKTGTTHRVSLNRHNSELIACEYDKLSSICEIKPIRLLEKILVYINKELERTKASPSGEALNINVCIIGHTEPSSKGEERELSDLLNAVVKWYNRSYCKGINSKGLRLTLTNIISEDDITAFPQKERRSKRIPFGNSLGLLRIVPRNFNSIFSFSTHELEQISAENDIVFILDCPWLTSENYEIKNNGMLDVFCNEIQDTPLATAPNDSFDNKFSTTMEEINTQFNRITSSDTVKYGKIARSFKDEIIRRIEGFVKKDLSYHNSSSNKQKDIFIFTSETDGIAYSYLSAYPLTREEMYEGKSATIIGFTNKPVTTLSVSKNHTVKFNIRLWSVLKYASISYAYIELKEIIDKCFSSVLPDTEIYFEILRDIVLCFEVDVARYKVSIGLNFSERMEKVLEELHLKSKRRAIYHTLFHALIEPITAIYRDIVFNLNDNSDAFGNELIRDAFEMNLYSSISDVQTIVFYCRYQIDRILKQNRHYLVQISDTYDMIRDNNFKRDFFMDKKLYDAVLSELFFSDEMEYDVNIAFSQSSHLFEDYDHKNTVVKNIINAYETLGLTHCIEYKNAIRLYLNI